MKLRGLPAVEALRAWQGGAGDDLLERCAVGAGILGIVVVWLAAGGGSSKAARAARRAPTPAERAQQLWLGSLASASLGTLAMQLALAVASGSLTLFADLGHAAGDVVSYAAAYLAERAKLDLACSPSASGPSRAANRIDAMSGLLSWGVVAGTSARAAAEAWGRLRAGAPPESAQHVGLAMLVFSCASTAVNAALLAARYVGPLAAPSDAPEPQAPSATGPRSSRAPPEVPAPPAPRGACAGRPRRGRAPRAATMLHAAFHAGCQCGAEHGREGAGGQEGETPLPWATNLNLYGAVLHLATDVARGVLVLAAGLLLQAGLLGDAARADAQCAMLVAACVFAGSATLLVSAFPALRRAALGAAGAGP